jgi:DNA mismatch endonuclease (patch repair protein)
MDTVDKRTRSRIMAAVRQNGTKPEILLRHQIHSMGFRYVLNDKRLPGSPDLVFPKYHAVVFVHGCFWHRHGCKYSTTPSTRKDFWINKFEQNIRRDKRKVQELRNKNWHVKTVWECKLRGSPDNVNYQALMVARWLTRIYGIQNAKNQSISCR